MIDSTFFKHLLVIWTLMVLVGLQVVTAKPLLATEEGNSASKTRYRAVLPSTKLHSRAINWRPQVGDTWQIVLHRAVKINAKSLSPDVKIWDIDMYDNDASTIKAIQQNGKKVICYFSAGSWEDWRDDAGQFLPSDIGSVLDGWPDERWLNIRSANVRNIMKKRIAYAASKGCNALDPDNVDGYQNANGLGLSKTDSINYIKFLSQTAASYGMGIGLKNAADIVPNVLNDVIFSIVEQCVQYSECAAYSPFIKAKKPVFQIEYPPGAGKTISGLTLNRICPGTTNAWVNQGFSVILKRLSLDGWAQFCGSAKTFSTATI